MAPEQASGEPVTAAADAYSLGAVLSRRPRAALADFGYTAPP